MAAHQLSCLVLALCILSALADNVFVSIDCGSSSSSSYTDENLIVWTGDDQYIKTGESHSVQNPTSDHVLSTLRAFTTRNKNCYYIDSIRQGRALVRATFYYGNYDNKSSPPTFDLQFDGNHWDTVRTSNTDSVYYEVTYFVKGDNLSVCLAQTIDGQFPFISALEFRGLESYMYSYAGNDYPLFLMRRADFGSNATTRFSNDPYDRIWGGEVGGNGLQAISGNATLSLPGVASNPPPTVLRTADATIMPTSILQLFMGFPPVETPVYINWYFSEVARLQPNQRRSFTLFMGNLSFSDPIIPLYDNFTQLYISNLTVTSDTMFFLVPNNDSTLPPLINAMEVFQIGDALTKGTNRTDVEGLALLRESFDVLQGWSGDPCLPAPYSWDWINCSSDSTPRVTALFLGSFGLSGKLPDTSSMDALQTIDLRNNSLNGTIPDFLSALPNLKKLNLADNKFSGSIPSSLSQKSGLNLVVSGNHDLCTPGGVCPSSEKSSANEKTKNKIFIILGTTILYLIMIWI